MSGTKKTLLWMAGLSLVTLGLGVLREFTIARELRASGQADLFFRGLVGVSAARGFSTALFRARWIPVPPAVPARRLLRGERVTCAAIVAVAILALLLMAGTAALTDPTLWVFVGCIALASLGAAVRALAERAGRERRGFLLEWALPLGAIAGALLVPHGALGPALGIFAGLVVGLVALLPVLADETGPPGQADEAALAAATGPAGFADGEGGPQGLAGAAGDGAVPGDRSKVAARDEAVPGDSPRRTRMLLIDALTYANLGLLDAGLSQVFAAGGFALLNYAYLFVNAAMMAPSAAATVVGLRLSAGGDPAVHAALRRWAVIGGLACAGLVVLVGLLLGWAPVAARVDAAVGWAMSAEIGALVLWSAPFAGLRMANTIGRQFALATAPERVIPWDLAGLTGRALILGLGAGFVGLAASPIGLAFAETVQVGAWWRGPPRRAGEAPG